MDKTIYTDFHDPYRFSSLQDLMERYPHRKPLDEYDTKRVVELLSYSVYYRALLKAYSCDELMQILTDEAPELLNQIEAPMLKNSIEKTKTSMGPDNIVFRDCNSSVMLNGTTFKGINDIKKQWKEQKSNENQSIIAAYDRFPCFDSYDCANENRYYWNFWFCNTQELETVQQLIEKQQHISDYCFLTEKLPRLLTPMVYYKDESKVMLVASNSNAF